MSDSLLTRWDRFRFDVLTQHCQSCGLTRRETVFVIAAGAHIAPFDDDVRAFRLWQSKGIEPGDSDGVQVLKRGKAQVESEGDLCSNSVRRRAYFGESKNGDGCWEGTAYWDEYPAWFTEILLWWHPRYAKRKAA
jgi:hypothetical protein